MDKTILLQSLVKLWYKLEGNKTNIGFALLYLDAKVDLPNTWWMTIIEIILYLWTGVGIGDKVRRKVIRTKNGT